jgi:ferric-dicitrate binding protein FerR (iron transport regulator)
MPESTAANLDSLLARLVERTITPEEIVQLETILDGSPDSQRRYLHYLALHSDLRDAAPGTVPVKAGERNRRPMGAALLAMAAAAVALGAVIALASRQPLPPETGTAAPLPIARIAELNGSLTWTGDGGQVNHELDVDDQLPGGTLETLGANSWAEIEFHDGSTVWVHGAAALTLSETGDGKLIRLRQGNLSVEVCPQAEETPLRIVTPSAEAEVLGTRFDISADQLSTRLTVNEGLVRVTRLADGSVQDVPADHFVVAALERKQRFEVRSRKAHRFSWASALPRDTGHGEWRPHTADLPGGLCATPLLWKEKSTDDPVLLHLASLRPSGDHLSPILLGEGLHFRIRGRLSASHRVIFGFTTRHANGGFSGKYITHREIEISPGSKSRFTARLPLDSFRPQKSCFPESPVGHELVDCWILTVAEDAGLEIASVELLK